MAISLTNRAEALAQTYTYDSFGNLTASQGTLANSFRYIGREFDSETGLYYYRARYYDSSTGRFLAEDPIRYSGGVNFYLYVSDRPTILRDPTGRFAWGVGVTGAGSIGIFCEGGGAEGGFYYVHDTLGNEGVLDCRAVGVGAVGGASASVQLTGLVCPDCRSICDMAGTFGGMEASAGLGGAVGAGGGASVSATSTTLFGGVGVGGGVGGGAVGVGGDCTLIWKRTDCPSCSTPPHK